MDIASWSVFHVYFGILLVAFVGVMCHNAVRGAEKTPAAGTADEADDEGLKRRPDVAFQRFQRSFIAVYLIMMAADWMQGPYVYRLYEFYGISRQDNGVLFIAGFGSSLFFGTWVGPLADRFGRKKSCVAYGVTYILSCMTKHVNHYGVLMVGRLLGGISTSILWSAFESWMTSEHLSRGFDRDLLGQTFSLMATGNGLVAIVSGLIAEWAVGTFGHPVAPFDCSAILLAIGTVVVALSWKENYGDASLNVVAQMKDSIAEVRRDRLIYLTGLQQALFEGAMYTFVFMWTPALDNEVGGTIPYGLIFASFMIATSVGGALFKFQGHEVPALTPKLYLVAAMAMAVPTMTTSKAMVMGAMLVFEAVVGLFWPAVGTLRSMYLPEHSRATITNLFRVPLNLVVCVVLYFQGRLSVSSVFVICTAFHLTAMGFAVALKHAAEAAAQPKKVDVVAAVREEDAAC